MPLRPHLRSATRRFAAGVTALLLASPVAGGLVTAEPAQASTTSDRFYVVGADIIAPDGSKFVPVGANVGVNMVTWSPPTYAFTAQGFTATGHVEDAVRWGWNMIRVNVDCNPPAAVSLKQTIDGVQRVIDEYTARKIVVMPDCHDFTGANPYLSDPLFANVHAFWDAIIARNGTNPYVWINYINEPFTKKSVNARWLEMSQALYDRVRGKATENLFVWDFPGWAQEASWLVGSDNLGRRLVEGRCNVALSWHNYGAAGTATQMTAQAKALVDTGLAVIVGELGYDWAGYRHNSVSYDVERRGGDWVFDNVARFGFGALYWHGTGTRKSDDLHSLRQGGKGAWYSDQYALSHAGQRLYDLGRNKPTFPRPNVDLAASNCDSAKQQSAHLASAAGPVSAVGAALTAGSSGLWIGYNNGGLRGAGHAPNHGDASKLRLNAPVVSIAPTPDGGGYWMLGRDGGVFSYGNAAFHGSTGGMRLNQPVVSMTADPRGRGYWFVAADGGVFSFGPPFLGSAGNLRLNQPVVGMAPTTSGNGYWLVARDGGVFAYGDAGFRGSTGGMRLNQPIVAMAADPDGSGYWFIGADGGVFAFDAPFHGSAVGRIAIGDRAVGLVAHPAGGYWVITGRGAAIGLGAAAGINRPAS